MMKSVLKLTSLEFVKHLSGFSICEHDVVRDGQKIQ